MKDTTILPVEDQAMEHALILRALDQNQMGEKIFVSHAEVRVLDFLAGRNMQSLL